MVETTSSAESLVFAQVLDGNVRVIAGGILDEVAEDGFVVVSNDEDFLDLRDLGNGREAVVDDRVAGNFEERL